MLWDAAWDQQNVIQGKVYSDHIADLMSGSGGASGAASTPGGSAPVGPEPGAPPLGGLTPGGSPSVPAAPPSPGGGGGAGMPISINFLTVTLKVSF